MIELGDVVRDLVSGYEGIATKIQTDLYRAERDVGVEVRHLAPNGETLGIEWFPEARLEKPVDGRWSDGRLAAR